MRIAAGLEALELSMNVMGRPSVIHSTLIWDADTVILVDAGYPGQLPQIREAMEKAGVPFAGLNKVIVTHHDMDHTGSLADIRQESANGVEVIAHEEERAYVQAEKPPVKVVQMESRLDTLPKEARALYRNLKANYGKYGAKVDRVVADGEELPYCGGIVVIHTPGHTPGHICLYLRRHKTLVAADALFLEGGVLSPAPAFVDLDHDLALRSLRKLTQYEIETTICYHGGVFRGDVGQRIAELAKG